MKFSSIQNSTSMKAPIEDENYVDIGYFNVEMVLIRTWNERKENVYWYESPCYVIHKSNIIFNTATVLKNFKIFGAVKKGLIFNC